MKIVYFVLVLIGGVFISCSDNDKENNEDKDFPISDLKIPENDTLWNPGNIITVEGKGFSENCELWFRNISTGERKQAEIVLVTSIEISFKTPEVYGEQELLLKQDEKEYILGKLVFEEDKGEEKPKLITKILLYEDNEIHEDIFEYDEYNRVEKIISYYYEDGVKDEKSTKHIYFYSDEQIRLEYWNYNATQPAISLFDLNDNGLITKYTYNSSSNYYYCNFDYDTNNRIVKSIRDIDEDRYDLFNWKNDNLISVEYYREGERDEQYTYNYSYYTEYENELNFDIGVLIGDFDEVQDIYLFGQGHMGQSNKNLLKGYSYRDHVAEYKYEFQENCIKIYEKWRSEAFILTYEIFYK